MMGRNARVPNPADILWTKDELLAASDFRLGMFYSGLTDDDRETFRRWHIDLHGDKRKD